jgi:Zn-dependent protease with chaperone function
MRRQLGQVGQVVGLAVRLAWRASPGFVAGVGLLMAVLALLQPVQLWLSRR